MGYEPHILEKGDLDSLASPEYLAFVDKVVFEAGVRLLVERHRKRPDFPYPDTKFNPNTGADLPEEKYGVLHPWFFGRGAEACAVHLRILDGLGGLDDVRDEARTLLDGFVVALTDAILETRERNRGRCPFRVNRDLQAIDEDGNPLEVDAEGTGAGDLFCAKGLVASGIPGKVETGKEMFERYVESALDLRYASEQTKDEAELVTHGSCMLALGAVTHLIERSEDETERVKWAELTARLIDFVLDRHYDPETAVFSEFVTREGAEKQPHLDPGHANELVGLGLEANETVRESGVALTGDVASSLERAENEFPRLLVKSFELGYNAEHHGLFKAVDNRTGEPINDDLPWWNLPETMRAAVRAAAVSDDPPDEDRLLDIARVCSNDYFAYYINPENMLFPYQTRSGKTGEVIDVAPAIPEGDPLYHTNLALIDMKAVLLRIVG